jgi:hypothetical protein
VESAVSAQKIEIIEIEISQKPMNDLEAILQVKEEKANTYLGYFASEESKHPSFVEKLTDYTFEMISWDMHWELKEIELIGKDKIQINKIESMKQLNETIEDAVEYLVNNSETKWRFFRSVRTDAAMLVFKISKNTYGVYREQIKL